MLRPKRLTNLQARALEAYRSTYCIDFHEEGSDELTEFLTSAPAIMEIGFGMGEVTAAFAQAHPDKHILGLDVFLPGVGKLLYEIHERRLEHVRIIVHDAVEVISHMIPADSLAGVHIFFPDPWPKKRHHKRRLVQVPFLQSLIPLLQKQGYIYMATDWEDYALQMLEACRGVEELENSSNGFCEPQSWRPMTKFEKRGLAKDHVIREILVRKR